MYSIPNVQQNFNKNSSGRYLDIVHIQMHSKIYVSRKAKAEEL
jgi:hypothetical protein